MGRRETVGPEEVNHGLEDRHLLATDEVVEELAVRTLHLSHLPTSAARDHQPRLIWRRSMKATVMPLVALLASTIAPQLGAASSHSVRGYVKKDGSYVQPHRQTNPNKSKSDNWSTKGNINPYTSKPGTVDPTSPRLPKKRKSL